MRRLYPFFSISMCTSCTINLAVFSISGGIIVRNKRIFMRRNKSTHYEDEGQFCFVLLCLLHREDLTSSSSRGSSANCNVETESFSPRPRPILFAIDPVFNCFVLTVPSPVFVTPALLYLSAPSVVFVTLAPLYLRPSSAGASYCFP